MIIKIGGNAMMLLKGCMETVDCIVCGNKNGTLKEIMHWKDDALHFAFCQKCGLKYMKRRPTQSWYSNFYQNEFWQNSRRKMRKLPNTQTEIEEMVWEETEAPDSQKSEWMSVASIRKDSKEHAQEIWEFIKPVVNLKENNNVVDIGSSFGEISKMLKEQNGCKVMAVEPSNFGRSYIEKYNIPIISRTIEDLKNVEGLEGKIDLIILGYVLENTTDPVANLKLIRPFLSENGKIYIDTSNFYYNNAINPYHPFIFTPETLNAVLGISGYKVIKQENEPNPMDIEKVKSFKDAIYIRTIAEQAPINNSWEPPKYPALEAQKRGIELAEKDRKK